jgi:hypothetical protein
MSSLRRPSTKNEVAQRTWNNVRWKGVLIRSAASAKTTGGQSSSFKTNTSESNKQNSTLNRSTAVTITMDSRDASSAMRKPAPKPLQSSSPKTQYLILYNFVSAILWLIVLGRVVLLVPIVGFGRMYPGVGRFAKWTQTMALLEVVHAATGRPYVIAVDSFD